MEFKAFVKKGKIANLTLGKETISGTLSTDGLVDGTARPGAVGLERTRAGDRIEDRRQEGRAHQRGIAGRRVMMCCRYDS